jgi:hypothetical protein
MKGVAPQSEKNPLKREKNDGLPRRFPPFHERVPVYRYSSLFNNYH